MRGAYLSPTSEAEHRWTFRAHLDQWEHLFVQPHPGGGITFTSAAPWVPARTLSLEGKAAWRITIVQPPTINIRPLLGLRKEIVGAGSIDELRGLPGNREALHVMMQVITRDDLSGGCGASTAGRFSRCLSRRYPWRRQLGHAHVYGRSDMRIARLASSM